MATASIAAAARRRLMRDLKELHDNPLETVAAAPVDDSNMFLWHANCIFQYLSILSLFLMLCSAWN